MAPQVAKLGPLKGLGLRGEGPKRLGSLGGNRWFPDWFGCKVQADIEISPKNAWQIGISHSHYGQHLFRLHSWSNPMLVCNLGWSISAALRVILQ